MLFSPLLLSYYDLPSKLRKCFLYCTIFPKDYKLEKNILIKLWMAQGYLDAEGREDIELVGEEYFKNLAVRSFFQDFERSEYDGSIISCKMHDIVHDFAQFLNKNECITIEVDALPESQLEFSYKKARHAMITLEKRDSFPITIYNEIKLRSLVIVRNNLPGISKRLIDLSELFDQLTCLRTLDLHRDHNYSFDTTVEIPGEIKKLIHLRYLNLSNNSRIMELPETLCDLYNLQTLDVSGCDRLWKLPEKIGKLMNLRHLMNRRTAISYLPKGMERLTCLRTLSPFIVSGCCHASKACSLQCLGKFSHLQGSLDIGSLGYITDVGEAKRAELKSKKNVLALSLSFNRVKVEEQSDEAVLEALQPHPNIERLSIFWYEGRTFSPSWILSLIKLRNLKLECIKSNSLPSIGKLPALESLYVHSMKGLVRLGNEFLGEESDSKPCSSSVVAFPKLKSLVFEHLREWKEWDYKNITAEKDVNNIMPCLCHLKIYYCDKLVGLPKHIFRTTTLEKLEIRWCRLLEMRFQKGKGWDWHKISHIPTVKIRD